MHNWFHDDDVFIEHGWTSGLATDDWQHPGTSQTLSTCSAGRRRQQARCHQIWFVNPAHAQTPNDQLLLV